MAEPEAAYFLRCAVGRTFREIASVEGSKSQDRKIKLITKLLVASKGMEPGYIMRALQVCILFQCALGSQKGLLRVLCPDDRSWSALQCRLVLKNV